MEQVAVLVLNVPFGHGKEHWVSGVVMNREECNGDWASKENCAASHDAASPPEMSARMKQLLHGVRLSLAAERMDPAGDLEELARRLDAGRNQRNAGRIGNRNRPSPRAFTARVRVP